MSSRHHIHLPANLGERIADVIAAFSGSIPFLLINLVAFVIWLLVNTIGPNRFDPYPFQFLTMSVSLEAIFLSIFVLVSQNRQAEKDRKRDDLEAEEVTEMYHINQRQLEILEILHELRGKQEAQA